MFDISMFERLPSWSQSEILTKKGTPLAHRLFKDWTITLYSLNGHLVERWSKVGLTVTTSFQASANPLHILEPYIDDIDLEEWL